MTQLKLPETLDRTQQEERAMQTLQRSRSNGRRQSMPLGITVGLAMLVLATLLWASASRELTAASSSADQEDWTPSNTSVITIGVAAALSGWGESLGWRQANAVQLAISQTNAAGGVDIGGSPYTLTMVFADSACSGTEAITAANTLIDAGAVAVVGHTCSGASFEAQPIYSAAGVPMVTASSTNPDLTEQGYTTTFRIIGKDGPQAVYLARYFRQWLGVDEVAIIERNYAWRNPATAAFSNTVVSLGGTIVSLHTVASTDDFTATLIAIQAEGPDAIYYADEVANNAGLLSSISHNQGLGETIIAWDAGVASFDGYATVAGPAAEGDYAVSYVPDADDMPGYLAFNAAYQASAFPNYGADAEMQGAYAYDAARIVIAAMDRAGSTDPAAIRNQIAAMVDYGGVAGTYGGFDANGDVIPPWVWLKRFENGQWMTLHPSRVFLPVVLDSFR
jgi:branched-chain amino acid transport system substrate-binding protein